MVRPPRQAEVTGIGLHDDDGVAEALSEEPGALRMRLDRDHPQSSRHQGSGHRSRPGPDVDDDGAGPEGCLSDEPIRPPVVQLVPPPRP